MRSRNWLGDVRRRGQEPTRAGEWDKQGVGGLMGVSDRGAARRSARRSSTLMGVLAIAAGIVIVMNLFKVSASLSLLTADLGIGASAGSWLVTVCTVVAVVLVLPAGGLADRFGPKRVGLFGLACAALGSAVGALCTDIGPLLASRALEGVGYGLTGVVSPAIIAEAFPPERRGIPMAVWSCWMDLGMLAVLNVANLVIDPAVASSWKGLWWLCAALTAALAAVYALAVREGPRPEAGAGAGGSVLLTSLAGALKSPATWVVSSVFLLYNVGVLSLLTLAPLYCQTQLGLGAAEANSYTSLLTIGMISGALATGLVLVRVRTLRGRIMLLAASMALAAAVLGGAYVYTVDQIVPFMLLGGLALSIMPAVGFTIVPETPASPAFAGAAIGLFILMGNLAGFGTPLIGGLMESAPAVLSATLVAVSLTGAALSLLLLRLMGGSAPAQGA